MAAIVAMWSVWSTQSRPVSVRANAGGAGADPAASVHSWVSTRVT
jgi:hypothetical protein